MIDTVKAAQKKAKIDLTNLSDENEELQRQNSRLQNQLKFCQEKGDAENEQKQILSELNKQNEDLVKQIAQLKLDHQAASDALDQ